ncbi:MAG: hypothetical protein GC202_07450 [Alphaproteobacteria bacterium]|nr:hypothetical protein [Alphaproteobacteria bacterium]
MIQPTVQPLIGGEFETDLPNGGVRIRMRPSGGPRRIMLLALSVATFFAAIVLAAYAPRTPTWIDAALLAAGGAGLFSFARRRGSAGLNFDRAGIRDGLLRRPPIPWWRMERLEICLDCDGRPAGLVACLAAGEGGERIGLPSASAAGLPVPFEYLVLLLHRQGAPIRRPDPSFDPFDCEIRWQRADTAAEILDERMGVRARPHAGHLLDVAETRGDRAAFEHWLAVLAALRQRAGLLEAAED